MAMQWNGIAGIGKETVYANLVAITRKIPVQRITAGPAMIKETDDRAAKSRYQFVDVLLGINEEFSWDQWVTATNFGEILLFMLGDVDTATLTTGEYRHTFSMVVPLPTFTLAVDHGLSANPTIRLGGSKINTVSLENASRGVLSSSVAGIARLHDFAAALSVEAADYTEFVKNPLIFSNLIVNKAYGGGVLSRDTDIERFAMSLNNNLVTDKVTADGSMYIHDSPEGKLEVTGAFEKEFDSITEYNQMIANVQLDITVQWVGASMGTNPYSLTIDIPNCRVTSVPLPEIAGGNDRQRLVVEFRALYSVADAYSISAVLDNDVASY